MRPCRRARLPPPARVFPSWPAAQLKRPFLTPRGPYYAAVTPTYLRELLEAVRAWNCSWLASAPLPPRLPPPNSRLPPCTLSQYGHAADGLKFAGGAFSITARPALRALLDAAHDHGLYVSTGGWIEHVLTQVGLQRWWHKWGRAGLQRDAAQALPQTAGTLPPRLPACRAGARCRRTCANAGSWQASGGAVCICACCPLAAHVACSCRLPVFRPTADPDPDPSPLPACRALMWWRCLPASSRCPPPTWRAWCGTCAPPA